MRSHQVRPTYVFSAGHTMHTSRLRNFSIIAHIGEPISRRARVTVNHIRYARAFRSWKVHSGGPVRIHMVFRHAASLMSLLGY